MPFGTFLSSSRARIVSSESSDLSSFSGGSDPPFFSFVHCPGILFRLTLFLFILPCSFLYKLFTSFTAMHKKAVNRFSGLPLIFYYPEFGGIKLFLKFLHPFLKLLLQFLLVRQIERILCCVYVGIFRKRQLNQRVFFAFAE